MIPTDLIWTGMALLVVAALSAACYSGYHRWNSRGRFTADGLYHRERAELGLKAVMIAGVLLFVLALLLGISK